MRVLLAGLLLVAACGPQFPQPDHKPRTAPIPEGRTTTAPTAPAVEPTPEPESASHTVRVDHAWVKAPTPAEQAKRRKAIEAMRTRVLAGSTFVVAWESLGEDGTVWHVAEGETYDAAILPPELKSVAIGQVSPVIPGDGGFHLFRILERD